MADDNEFAAAGADAAPGLIVKEGEDIDYRVVLAFYLLADLAFVICFIFAYEEGYWVVCVPFLPLTLWMGYKVYVQQRAKNGVTASAATDKKSVAAKKAN